MSEKTTSELDPIMDAMAFVRFTDRAIGNKFEAALKELKRDLDEGTYEPSNDSEQALKALRLEVDDALEKLDDETVTVAANVEAEEEVETEVVVELEDENENEDPLDSAFDEDSETNESTG